MYVVKKNQNQNQPQKTIEPPLIRGLEDYDEELDEDYNENDGSSHSEEIINDCDDESNPYSDLAHIELVDGIYYTYIIISLH